MTAYLNIIFPTSWRRGWPLPVTLRAFKASPPYRWPLTLIMLGCYEAVVTELTEHWMPSLDVLSPLCTLHLSPINGPTVISSVQTTPKHLLSFSFPMHVWHSLWLWCNWPLWYVSHTLTQFFGIFVTCDEHAGLISQALCSLQTITISIIIWSTGVKPVMLTEVFGSCFPEQVLVQFC